MKTPPADWFDQLIAEGEASGMTRLAAIQHAGKVCGVHYAKLDDGHLNNIFGVVYRQGYEDGYLAAKGKGKDR